MRSPPVVEPHSPCQRRTSVDFFRPHRLPVEIIAPHPGTPDLQTQTRPESEGELRPHGQGSVVKAALDAILGVPPPKARVTPGRSVQSSEYALLTNRLFAS